MWFFSTPKMTMRMPAGRLSIDERRHWLMQADRLRQVSVGAEEALEYEESGVSATKRRSSRVCAPISSRDEVVFLDKLPFFPSAASSTVCPVFSR